MEKEFNISIKYEDKEYQIQITPSSTYIIFKVSSENENYRKKLKIDE